MKRFWFRSVAFLVMTCGLALAQQSSNGLSTVLAYENGSITNNIYTNECFGFSLAVPDGWLVRDRSEGDEAIARHISEGNLLLLALDRKNQNGTLKNAISLNARVAIPSDMTAQEFVSTAVHAQIDAVDRQSKQLIHDAYSVEYGSKRFFRADYERSTTGDLRLVVYLALVYTKFRGYFIGGTLIAHSLEGLDESSNSLQQISFQEDERNPKCGMRGNDNPNSEGVMGGVISSKPILPSSNQDLPQRVRISQGVSTGLLITKVQPQYPDDAKQARIQGQVILKALIDKNGDVEELTLVSGHPMLAPAAIEAVKQWKYKPYLLNDQPVKVETLVTVSFQLSGH